MKYPTTKLIERNIYHHEKELNAVYFGLMSHISGEPYQLQDKNNLYNIPPQSTTILLFKDHKGTRHLKELDYTI